MAEKSVKFALTGITTDQFATISEPEGGEFGLNMSVAIKSDYNNRGIGLNLSFKFEENEVVFMLIETTTHFVIDESYWNEASGGGLTKVVLPKDFVQHLVTLAIGTTRGVLHSKTENTSFNRFVIPLINVTELGGEDAIIEKE